MIAILKPGFYTTIQDLGRFGYQRFGMPVAGSMDIDSHRLANWLVGNPVEAPLFEITLAGPKIQFHKPTKIGITGADMSPKLNGESIEMYQTIVVKKGDVLSFGPLKSGCRTYLAVKGTLKIPKVMGSFSTYVYANVGGVEGRTLISGDTIECENSNRRTVVKTVPEALRLKYFSTLRLRVLPGLEMEQFSEEMLNRFLSTEYKISSQSNRMGYRLKGDAVTQKEYKEIVSSGMVLGTIQIPENGQPIVMMSDRQTTGGYPRIANVIGVDIVHLAQQKTGDKIRFQLVNLQEAQALWITKEKRLLELFD